MPTVGQIVDKISELRSKIAISDYTLRHLRTYYFASDHGEAEMKLYRDDQALVSEGHVRAYLDDLDSQLKEYKAELKHWESLAVPVETAKTMAKGKRNAGITVARGGGQNQPAAADPDSEDDG